MVAGAALLLALLLLGGAAIEASKERGTESLRFSRLAAWLDGFDGNRKSGGIEEIEISLGGPGAGGGEVVCAHRLRYGCGRFDSALESPCQARQFRLDARAGAGLGRAQECAEKCGAERALRAGAATSVRVQHVLGGLNSVKTRAAASCRLRANSISAFRGSPLLIRAPAVSLLVQSSHLHLLESCSSAILCWSCFWIASRNVAVSASALICTLENRYLLRRQPLASTCL